LPIQVIKGAANKRLQDALNQLDKKVAKVGWFTDAKYEKGTQVAYVAAIQEYGYPSKNIPPRPFFRPTIATKQNEWSKIIESGSRGVLNGRNTVYDVFEGLGQRVAGDVRKTISLITTPPLKPATIAARLNRRANGKTVGNLTKPLIDTGHMYGTLINKTENE
jgi:hypothetical protein